MQHRFRTFLPPASGPARAPTAVWGSEVHNETGTGASEQLPEGGRISPDGLAVHEHVCTAGNPAGGAVGKGSFLQCSMSGLVPADAEHSFESLRCLLTKSCSRMSPCCFVDRRSMMVRCRRTCLPSQACPHAAPLVTPAATGTPGSVNYGVVVRTYVYPEGLSGACLVNVVARPESDTAGDWQSTLTGPEIDRPGTGRGHAPVHSVDPPKFEKVDRKSTDASAPAGVNQSVGVSQHRASKRQDVDMVLCYEAVTTGATGDFFHLLDLTEHQVECWKGHVYEFRGGEESDLPHSVFLCRVYTDTAATKEAYSGCVLVHVCTRASLSRTASSSDLQQSAARMTECLLKVRKALRPYVRLKKRHFLSMGESSLAGSPEVFPQSGDGRMI